MCVLAWVSVLAWPVVASAADIEGDTESSLAPSFQADNPAINAPDTPVAPVAPQNQLLDDHNLDDDNLDNPSDRDNLVPDKPVITKEKNGNGKNGFDSDARTPLGFQITPELSVGAKANLEVNLTDNLDTDPDESDFLTMFESQISLAGLYQPTEKIELFGEMRLGYATPLWDTADEEDDDASIKFREGYVRLQDFPTDDWGLQVGRQRLKDRREWMFDERLDAVRITYDTLIADRPADVEFSISSMLIEPDGREDEIINYILYATYEYAKKEKISLFVVGRDDHRQQDRDPVFLGLSWKGRPHKRTKMWLDTALLVGQERQRDLLSYGLDVGVTQRIKHPLKPALTVAFAYGSGDPDPRDGTDRNFQQTDLQDNNAKFDGSTKFKYYGEIFDPELSNMMIFTFGAGVAPSKKFSLDVIYHYYVLVELTDELRDADIEEDLTGNDRDLGHEVDLILGLRFDHNIRASVSSGVFFPGSAYDDHDPVYGAEFKVQIPF